MIQSIVDDIDTSMSGNAKIKVIGVGGGGGNAVRHMIDSGLRGVQFVCANTDLQALNKNDKALKVQLGEKLTKGLGAGANPAIGREAAVESVSAIRDAIGDADMVFVTAGMGGGTGTGAAPVVAQAAKEMGALTVGVVTTPFSWEGVKRKRAAEAGLAEFRKHVDCLLTIPNDRLRTGAPKLSKVPFTEMLQRANDVLYYAVKGIADVISGEGLINLDFADVRTTMSESGPALMGTGIASGENRAREAAQRAISSPLLDDVSLESAKAILYNITAPMDITGEEIDEIGNLLSDAAPVDANIIFGVVLDDSVGDELHLTVIATGIEQAKAEPEPVVAPVSKAIVRDFSQPGPDAMSTPGRPRRIQQGSLVSQEETVAEERSERPSRREAVRRWYEEKDNRPPYIIKQEALGQQRRSPHRPGYDDFVYNEDDFEMPTFIRIQPN